MSTRPGKRSSECWDADPASADLEHQFGARAAGLPQQAEYDPDEVAFETTERLPSGLAFGLAAFEVRARSGFPAALHDSDLVQRRVELAVAVPVKAVATLLARGAVDGGDSSQPGELRLVAKAINAGSLADQLGRDQYPAPSEFQQLRCVVCDQHGEFAPSSLASAVSWRQRRTKSRAMRTLTVW